MMEEIGEGVFVHQSPLLRNNAVAVRGSSGILLVDPGLTNDEMVDLANGIRDLRETVEVGFATHPDWDHVLWHPALGKAPRYGTARCANDLRDLRSSADWQARVAEGMPPEIAADVPMEGFGEITALTDDLRLPWGGGAVRVIEHRAHAAGHAALLLEEQRVLVAGDMLSDVFPPMLDLDAVDPIGDYLSALSLFDELVDHVDIVVPGHGSVGGPGALRARIDLDRAYLLALRGAGDSAGNSAGDSAGDGAGDGGLDDPRIGASAEPGWEWVGGIHDWQVQRLTATHRL